VDLGPEVYQARFEIGAEVAKATRHLECIRQRLLSATYIRENDTWKIRALTLTESLTLFTDDHLEQPINSQRIFGLETKRQALRQIPNIRRLGGSGLEEICPKRSRLARPLH
jgi:hypothetical protein